MIYIAHRGNTVGPDPINENRPEHLQKAITQGFFVEADVWFTEELMLGHDAPTYQTNLGFLMQPSVWCHAKNVEALEFLLYHGAHCFWHQNDDQTLTSKGWIWMYPGKVLPRFCKDTVVVVMPELVGSTDNIHPGIGGVCSDFVKQIRDNRP